MNLQESIRRILREETSDMKDIIFDMINDAVEGVDVYEYKGELWLIFTDENEWVIKLTKEGNLYYNYYFFQDIFKYFSMDVIENQHYITEWVEDTKLNGVKYNYPLLGKYQGEVEDTILNGVKYTNSGGGVTYLKIDDTIRNGVKLNKS